MRKLLLGLGLGLGIVVMATSGFAQTSYVVYQGKLKGQVSPGADSAIAKYGDNVVLVVDTASDAAMMVRYGKDKATGPWVDADITTYRQDGKALNGKDGMSGVCPYWDERMSGVCPYRNNINERVNLR